MATLIHVLQFFNIFAWAMLEGGMVWVALDTIPAMRRHTVSESVRVHQTMLTDLPDRYLPVAGGVGGMSGFAVVLLHHGLSPVAGTCYALGLAAGIVVIVATLFFNIPVNRMLATLPHGHIPPGYIAIRERWDNVHRVRSCAGAIALACFVVAGLAY